MGTRRIPSVFVTGLISPRTAVRAGLVLIVGLVVCLLLELPAFVEFGLAVAAAAAWCVLLDAQSARSEPGPEPSPDGGARVDAQPGTSTPVMRIVAVSKPDRRSINTSNAA